MTKIPRRAGALAAAAILLAGCGAQQQAAAPIEVIEIEKEIVALPSPDDPVNRPRYHVVVSGETLGKIALDYGLDYRELALWNNIPNPDLIEVGQRLQLHPPATQPEVTAIKPIKAEAPTPSRVRPEDGTAASPGRVTRAQVGVGGGTRRESAVEVLEPVALKLPWTEADAERLMGQSGGVERAALEVRAGPARAGAPSNTRERNGIVWSWPANGKLSDDFSDTNKGIDISGARGQPVYSSASGKVIYAGSGLKGYGQLVIIKHENDYLSAYAHNDRIFVAEGEAVTRGHLIAEMGDSGADRVGLHFEIRRGSDTYDPQQFLPKNP